ncbi:MAG: acyltransferase family protein [Gemmatimonadota bacterium]|nr:acyltransferase family protein [Gemmatimonadota bacterium]
MDGLRGSMMLLGVALHAAVAYMRTPLGELWGFKDQHTHYGFDVLVAVVHTFRMPVFFVMAGFFAALLFYQRGAHQMIRNRAQRVLVPLAIGWLVLFPLTIAGFAFARLGGAANATSDAIRYAASTAMLEHLQLLHLWFLFDLLVYYGAALLVCRLVHRTPDARRRNVAVGFGWLLQRWYAPLLLAVPTVLTLAPMPSGMLETPGTFLRPPATLAAHGVFFTFGWLLYLRRDLLQSLTKHAWGRTLAGCALFPLHGLAVIRLAGQADQTLRGVAIVSLAVMIWLFVFGLTGLFVRYLGSQRPLGRYVADASYWFYLLHLPLVVWGSGLLAGRPWPAGVKYAVLLTAVVVVCWGTYDVAVRPTIVGVFLNGRRYPRGLPAPATSEMRPLAGPDGRVSTTPVEPHTGSTISVPGRRSINVQR